MPIEVRFIYNLFFFGKQNQLQKAPPPFSAILVSIQVRSFATSAYTPDIPSAAQPSPQLTTPTRSCLFVPLFFTVKGPPLSPWQLSFPVAPAHSICSEILPSWLDDSVTHWPVLWSVKVTESEVWAEHSVSEMIWSSTSNKVAWVVAGHEAVDPQPYTRPFWPV